MVDNTNQGGDCGVNRRRFLKTTGTGVVGLALAGCTGSGGSSGSGDGGGGDGGGGGGSGGGDGGNGAATTGGSSFPDEITVTYPPTGWWAVLGDIMDNRGLIQKYKDEHGVDTTFNDERTWDDVPLFSSGQAEIAQFGSLEASRLGPNEDIPITVFGKVVPQAAEMVVAGGGDFDPGSTGGVEQTIEALANSGEPVGIDGWGSGSTLGAQITIEEEYGYTFQQETADFNIVTADYFAMCQLVVKGELAAGLSSPMLGGAPFYSTSPPEAVPLFHFGESLNELGFGHVPLENQVTRTGFFEEHTEVCQVYHDAMREAMSVFHEDPIGIITQSDAMIEALGVANEREAVFATEYEILLENNTNDLEPPEMSSVYEEYALDDEWIETDKNALDKFAEIGQTNENWAEYVTYEKMG